MDDDDTLLYRHSESGGALWAEAGRAPDPSERLAGRALADEGRRVRLLRRTVGEPGVKSYDADVDGEPWEFKELTVPGEREPDNAVYQGLRSGKRQNNDAPLWLLYHIHWDQRKNIALVESAIGDAVRRDHAGLIRGVTLVFDDGSLFHRTRTEIDEGKKFRELP